MDDMESDLDLTRMLLADSFGRVRDLVASVTAGLSREVSTYRPDEVANTVGWLIWHLARVEDDHVCELAGVEQVWTSNAWVERFGLPFEPGVTGYGHSSAEVITVDVESTLLDGYHAEVHRRTLRYVESLTTSELAHVVDESWDPPVTVAVRLVSVLDDCLQHGGQAAYVRGLAERARR